MPAVDGSGQLMGGVDEGGGGRCRRRTVPADGLEAAVNGAGLLEAPAAGRVWGWGDKKEGCYAELGSSRESG